MNKNILNSLLVASSALALASCGENTWNDHFLKGFEGGVDYESSVSGQYKLTVDDYKAISALMEKKATSDEEKAEAKAIASNCYFNKYGAFPASVALPPFMETAAFPYYLGSNGSYADISYAEASEVPAELAAIAGATEYTVSADDYKSAWGSDVDFIAAFAPMASAELKLPGILKTAYPDAATGAYAIVRYNESSTNPIFISNSDAEEFTAGAYFMVADGNICATPVAANKTYGYLGAESTSVAEGSVHSNETNVFLFIPAEGGYHIQDVYGRYLFQKDSFNSFNLSLALPEEGALWTVELASNGQATVKNTLVDKWIQFDSGYNSWGSYPEAKGSLPVLYKAPDPKYYLVTADGNGACPVAASSPYGYLSGVDMTVENGAVVSPDPANAFTFEVSDEGFYIKDSYGRYLYMKGSFNNFNVSTEVPESGALWTLTQDADGNVTIMNSEMGKWLQYSTNYGSWGAYDVESGVLPRMYNAALSNVASAARPAKVVAGNPVTYGVNAVYYFDGGNWAPASGVVSLNPSDYEAMGVSNGSLSDPETFIPLYLKNKLPYAQNGDEQIVVYNYNKTGLFVYNGSNWTLNNNGLEEVVGRFTKSNNAWSFTKYIGKAIFDLFNQDQVIRDRSYLLVYDNICATALDKGSSYGYINVSNVEVSGETIVLPSDANAYTFAASVTVADKEYSVPEGKFLMKDSNNRYIYISGTYKSFNVKDNPDIADGAVSDAFLWTASRQADGSWAIKNVGASVERIWGYSINHTSFGAYESDSFSDTQVLPTLYIMNE